MQLQRAASCNTQGQHAPAACTCSMHLQHAPAACRGSMQMQQAGAACRSSMQVQHTDATCTCSVQLQCAAAPCNYNSPLQNAGAACRGSMQEQYAGAACMGTGTPRWFSGNTAPPWCSSAPQTHHADSALIKQILLLFAGPLFRCFALALHWLNTTLYGGILRPPRAVCWTDLVGFGFL